MQHLEQRPDPADHDPSYRGYIDRVPEGNVLETLGMQIEHTLELLAPVDELRSARAYAEGKWTLRELVGHMIDCERVFTYRALSIARGDPAELPGMDQDLWARASGAQHRRFEDLREEYRHLRLATCRLFEGFREEEWQRSGTANGARFLVRVVPWILAGHERHHLDVIHERYLGEA